ncbi:MAG: DUF3325 domain-containing protein [Oxalicibacterium faecigallinarum]|uniref:Iron uptake protein n=1 Tax=Oxalicibacterium faecigallinarum TaxID=573741 RepID=A0A8J3AR06_9BURK|nr:DUF3325 domain-containing protein [Oxalicibacterium faecigallinarum]MDQ7968851.1 DUF3325 domain-containing protein [Oxalicibacterium faecigallinarum]GGI17154.1 iron uptake protein [Oxalicibacterium faecigallinarum]
MTGFGFVASLALAYAGWTALSVGMDRHYADIHGRGKEPDRKTRNVCRLLGTIALLLTFAVSVRLQGWTVGSVLCLGTMTAGALMLVLLLTYAPQRAIGLGRGASIAALIFGIIWLAW